MQAARRDFLSERWLNVPFHQIRDGIQKAVGGRLEEVARAGRALEEWLVVHAEDGTNPVLQSLREVRTNSWEYSAVVFQAMTAAGVPVAQNALGVVLRDVEGYPPTSANEGVGIGGIQ